MSKTSADIRSLARAQTEKAIKTLTGIMSQDRAPAAARVAAAQAILDRGWGKATQTIEARIANVDPAALTDAELAAAIVATDGSEDSIAAPARSAKPH
jgi:hypothetical protein